MLVNCLLLAIMSQLDLSAQVAKSLVPYGMYLLDVQSTLQIKAGKIAQSVTLTVKAEPLKFDGWRNKICRSGLEYFWTSCCVVVRFSQRWLL